MADSKMSAAKGTACFGTAGWHSQVCFVLCMMEFEGKYAEQSPGCSLCLVLHLYTLKSSVFLTCVRGIPAPQSAQPWCGNVLLDQLSRGCSSFSSACIGCFVSRCIAEESPGSTDFYRAVSARQGRQTERHIVLKS
jgi:hypothetical protein